MPPSLPHELDLADTLLSCLEAALAANPNPPGGLCLRVGEEVRQDLSIYQDECCDGLAYVRIAQVFPSVSFPEILEDPTDCAVDQWAVDLEMGVFRCAPTGTLEHLATCEQWNNAASQVQYDAAAMRAAIACFRGTLPVGDEVVVRPWLPLGPAGACTGGTQIVTASFAQSC
jgi:hypothetical protein